MFWLEGLKEKLDKKKKHLVSDSWSTSGFAHIGSLRGAVIHNIAYENLKKSDFKVGYKFLMDDFDPLDGIPVYLEKKEYKDHLGKPLFQILSPKKGKVLSEYFADDFIETLKNLNITPEILKASDNYKSGLLNEGIKTILDNASKIREIYKKITGSERPKDWYPFNPICEKCGKIGTTRVFDWDGEQISYKCEESLVEWAKGCGYSGKVSPFNGTGKLPWRIEWPVRWKALGVTVEGEGKDHWSAGGSRDMADIISREVLKYEPPYDIRYDFFVIGGKKMSSSQARGITARVISEMLPQPIFNYLLASNPRKEIEFDPKGDTIPILYDNYDRAREAFFKRVDMIDLAKMFEMSQIEKPQDGYRMRFIKVAYAIQMPRVDIMETAEKEKGFKLTKSELEDLEERIEYAQKWLKEFAPDDYVFEVKEELPEEEKTLNKDQKNFLKELEGKLEEVKWEGQEIHSLIHNLKNEIGITPKDAFSAIYIAFLGKGFGPQAGWLLSSLDKKFVLKRLSQAIGKP